MADYLFSMMFDPGKENINRALEIHQLMTDDAIDSESAIMFRIERDCDQLWIEDGQSSDVDGVVRYVQKCAEEFKLKGRWGFEWSNTCTKARLDAYGGGVVTFDFDKQVVESVSTADFLRKWLAGHPVADL